MLIFRRIFLSNYWWQKSDIWSQASYRYPISWEAFLDPSDSYCLFADFGDFYTHWTYMLIFRHIFLINYWWQRSDIWSQASYWYPTKNGHIQNVCSMCIKINKVDKQEVGIWWVQKRFPRYGVPIWSLWPNIRSLPSIVDEKDVTKNEHTCSMCIKITKIGKQAVGIWTIDGRNLIFDHKLHIGTPYRGKCFWTHQIPTSCLPTLLIFIHIEHIKNTSHDMGYLYEACDQISDFCHQ
jgi:hypothetical protein